LEIDESIAIQVDATNGTNDDNQLVLEDEEYENPEEQLYLEWREKANSNVIDYGREKCETLTPANARRYWEKPLPSPKGREEILAGSEYNVSTAKSSGRVNLHGLLVTIRTELLRNLSSPQTVHLKAEILQGTLVEYRYAPWTVPRDPGYQIGIFMTATTTSGDVVKKYLQSERGTWKLAYRANTLADYLHGAPYEDIREQKRRWVAKKAILGVQKAYYTSNDSDVGTVGSEEDRTEINAPGPFQGHEEID
jgi:hypothetical protein